MSYSNDRYFYFASPRVLLSCCKTKSRQTLTTTSSIRNFPESDFWPGVVFEYPVIRPELGPTIRVESKAITPNG